MTLAKRKSAAIEESSTITAKGQTTVPKSVRQTLGLGYGGKIAFRIESGRVTVHNPEAGQADPALSAFLDMLARDMAPGRGAKDLPKATLAALRRARKEAGPLDLNALLEGDVAL